MLNELGGNPAVAILIKVALLYIAYLVALVAIEKLPIRQSKGSSE
ncbi:MAG: hypothetical protein P1U89_12415 [Verrucomicrobiales bacterium]|nr:hypothetical protein [Verrucomicrobiales bacterium]